MQFFQRWFKHSNQKTITEPVLLTKSTEVSDEWEKIPGYVAADEKDYLIVSLITSAIAASDRSNSQFKVKRLLQRNSEVVTVSLIASSIAASIYPEKQFQIKSIYCKR
ncbi:hypothetical protein ACVR0P_06395 [Streptococcus castoreus]|uniref:hypothetical protein n=1 Tax=Streptococcus castoreus TaxID=254786 RepID=UPI00041E923E|nr:hypothetical protein [Streptococcus castoreus]